MIFKTFDNNIDKISSKWGMFGRSFNDIGTAIRNKIISFSEQFEQTGKTINSWGNSDSIWKKLYHRKKSIKSQLIDVDSLYPDISDTTASNLLTKLQKEQILVDANKKSWQNYFNGLADGEKWQIDFVQNTDLQKASLSDVKNAYESARASAIAHNEAIKAQTLSAKAGKVALQGLATAGNMLAFMAITKGIELAAKGIDKLIETEKEATDALENAKSVSDSYKSSIHDVISSHKELSENTNEITEPYAKLAQGVDTDTNKNISLSNSDYEEFLDLNSQLADLFPSLIKGYDENGNAILGLGGNVDTVTGKIQAMAEQQERLANTEILNNLKGYVNGDDGKGGQLEEIKRLDKKKNDADKLVAAYDSVRKMFDTDDIGDVNKIEGISSAQVDKLMQKAGFETNMAQIDTAGFWHFNLDDSEMRHLKETFSTYYEELISEAQTAKDELSMANAEMSSEMMYWVQSLSQYTSSDENMQTAMMNMVNGINWTSAGASNYDEAKDAIQQLVLTPLNQMSGNPDVQKQFSSAISGLFTLNISDMPAEQAKEVIANYIQQIMNILNQFRTKDNQLSLDDTYSMFGFTDFNNDTTAFSNSLSNIAGSNTSDMKYFQNLKNLISIR